MKLAQVDVGNVFGSPVGKEGGVTLGQVITTGLNLAFAVAGVLILFMLVYAGFKIVQSAGGSNPQEAEKAKAAATSAAVGFVIIFVAYWIIKLIETITGSSFITNPGL